MRVIDKTKPQIDCAVVDLMTVGYGGNIGEFLKKYPQYRATIVIYYSALTEKQFNRGILNMPNTFYVHKEAGSIKTVMERMDGTI